MEKPVIIAEYDPEWPGMFRSEKKILEEALGENALAIEHVGSTSVEGLAAKPIIDILVGIKSLGGAKVCIDEIEKLGYVYHPEHEGELPDRRYLDKPGFHVHMVEKDGDFWKKHVFFRNYLRTHHEAMKEYEDLKRKLAVEYRNDRGTYTDMKGPFIEGIVGLMAK